MALGKLWNAFFGKREAEAMPPTPEPGVESQPARPSAATGASAAAGASAGELRATAPDAANKVGAPTARRGSKSRRASKTDRAQGGAPAVATGDEPSLPPIANRPALPARPRTNAWTKQLAGRSIGSILDIHLGDATRAVELLQAIVCEAAPIPKYVAIDLFELGEGPLSVAQFHQQIRRTGAQPVAIPNDLHSGLRQLSQTLGAVDLILLDGPEVDLNQLEFRRLLSRVTHEGTLVLHHGAGGQWQPVEIAAAGHATVAAVKSQAA